MSKKKVKSKQTDNERQRIVTAQKRKEFVKQIKYYCDLIHPGLFDILTPRQLSSLFLIRGMSVKVVSCGKVSKKMMEFADDFARMSENIKDIPFNSEGEMISIKEFHQYVIPLQMILLDTGDERDMMPNIRPFVGVPWYEKFNEEEEMREMGYTKSMDMLRSNIQLYMSDLRFLIFHVDQLFHPYEDIKRDPRVRPEVSLKPLHPKRKKIKLRDGSFRTGIRFVMASPRRSEEEDRCFTEVSVPLSALGVKGSNANKPLPLYVTEHALKRLDERIAESRYSCYTQLGMMTAFMDDVPDRRIIRLGDGKLLVPYSLLYYKIGYLVISIQEDTILIRTFLLITSAGTPEGKALHEQFGLQKLDHQFLGIDRLSTFVNSDILDNKDISDLFINAGCGSLLDFCKHVTTGNSSLEDKEDQIQLAARMRDYLSKGEQEEWDIPGE